MNNQQLLRDFMMFYAEYSSVLPVTELTDDVEEAIVEFLKERERG